MVWWPPLYVVYSLLLCFPFVESLQIDLIHISFLLHLSCCVVLHKEDLSLDARTSSHTIVFAYMGLLLYSMISSRYILYGAWPPIFIGRPFHCGISASVYLSSSDSSFIIMSLPYSPFPYVYVVVSISMSKLDPTSSASILSMRSKTTVWFYGTSLSS